MKTIETTLYTFDELSEEAQERAIEKYLNSDRYYHWGDENRKTAEEFSDLFGVSFDYQYDTCSGWATVNTGSIEDDILELKGARLLSYIWNNYGADLFNRKYLKHGETRETRPEYHRMRKVTNIEHGPNAGKKIVSYYSNIQRDSMNCPLTGYCVDNAIIYPIVQLWENFTPEKTFEDVLQECFNSWVEECQKDFEHFYSEEYAREELSQESEEKYNKDGQEF